MLHETKQQAPLHCTPVRKPVKSVWEKGGVNQLSVVKAVSRCDIDVKRKKNTPKKILKV